MTRSTPLGTLLVQQGLITEAQLAAALGEQERAGRPLGRVLIEQGIISEAELVRTLARQVGLEFVDLADLTLDGSVTSIVTETFARRSQALPIGWDEDGKLVVAMADPSNVLAVDDIRARSGADVRTVVATPSQILATIDRCYQVDAEVDDLVAAASDEAEPQARLDDIDQLVEDAPIVKFVNLLVQQAVTSRASDIHVEPT
ncbi:MAG: GspE/PulE family protein, partial [Actinomycetota bacterium]